jgi:hypothetical protein
MGLPHLVPSQLSEIKRKIVQYTLAVMFSLSKDSSRFSYYRSVVHLHFSDMPKFEFPPPPIHILML